MIAHQLTDRTTGDLDLFTTSMVAVGNQAFRFIAEIESQGAKVDVRVNNPGFVSFVVSGLGLEPVVVDVGVDYRLMPAENHEELGPNCQREGPIEPNRAAVGLTIDGSHNLMLPTSSRGAERAGL